MAMNQPQKPTKPRPAYIIYTCEIRAEVMGYMNNNVQAATEELNRRWEEVERDPARLADNNQRAATDRLRYENEMAEYELEMAAFHAAVAAHQGGMPGQQ